VRSQIHSRRDPFHAEIHSRREPLVRSKHSWRHHRWTSASPCSATFPSWLRTTSIPVPLREEAAPPPLPYALLSLAHRQATAWPPTHTPAACSMRRLGKVGQGWAETLCQSILCQWPAAIGPLPRASNEWAWRFRAAWGDSELHIGPKRDSEFRRGRALERYANAQAAVCRRHLLRPCAGGS